MPRRSLRVRPLVVVWPDASLDGPVGRQTDLRVVEQPAASSIGWPRHQMACGVGWLPASSISHPCRRSACHVVDCLAVDSLAVLSTGVWALDRAAALSIGRCVVELGHRLAYRMVDSHAGLSIIPPCFRLTWGVVVRTFAAVRGCSPSAFSSHHCRGFS